MKCPLEQMAKDHLRDVEIIEYFTVRRYPAHAARGVRMWLLASRGMGGIFDIHKAFTTKWINYLQDKYDQKYGE